MRGARSGEGYKMATAPWTATGKTVLVVEGNAIVREGTAVILRREGYSVALNRDGQEAMTVLRGGLRPDLVLLDMAALLGDGRHFIELLKEEGDLAAVPIVVFTAAGLDHAWAESLGCAGFLAKPVEDGPLLAEVRRCLHDP